MLCSILYFVCFIKKYLKRDRYVCIFFIAVRIGLSYMNILSNANGLYLPSLIHIYIWLFRVAL
ncbi:hypothetical protein A0T30_16510 [Aquipseudomonas alcaligenes]|nr:hypothetical protein A0T30_16510 [Pseudomonas alcaligenes]